MMAFISRYMNYKEWPPKTLWVNGIVMRAVAMEIVDMNGTEVPSRIRVPFPSDVV
jgi:hypothetical protein